MGQRRSNGGGRGAHGTENPRTLYAVRLRTEPAPLVRGRSRRITIMRCQPANIRVINRRDSRSAATDAAFLTSGEDEDQKNALRNNALVSPTS
jgi:hypothetical protein